MKKRSKQYKKMLALIEWKLAQPNHNGLIHYSAPDGYNRGIHELVDLIRVNGLTPVPINMYYRMKGPKEPKPAHRRSQRDLFAEPDGCLVRCKHT